MASFPIIKNEPSLFSWQKNDSRRHSVVMVVRQELVDKSVASCMLWRQCDNTQESSRTVLVIVLTRLVFRCCSCCIIQWKCRSTIQTPPRGGLPNMRVVFFFLSPLEKFFFLSRRPQGMYSLEIKGACRGRAMILFSLLMM